MSKWNFNLNKSHHIGEDLPDPFGYNRNYAAEVIESEKKQSEMKTLLERKAWQFATGGVSQILMSLFMLWITGSNLNIFTIILTFSVIMQPLKALFNVNSAFKQFEGKKISLFQAKVVYIGINALVLAIGLNKLYSVGLLPFSPSDWIDLIPRQTQTEIAIDVKL